MSGPVGWLGGLLLFIGVQALLMTDQLNFARAAVGFPNATELTVKEIGKDSLAVEHQFGSVFYGGLDHGSFKMVEHFTVDFRTGLASPNNFERKFVYGVHSWPRLGIELEEGDIVHYRLQFSGGFAVVFEAVGEFWRQEQDIRGLRWKSVNRVPGERLLQVTFDNDRENLSALRIHDGLGIEVSCVGSIGGGLESAPEKAGLCSENQKLEKNNHYGSDRKPERISVQLLLFIMFFGVGLSFFLVLLSGKYLYDNRRIFGASLFGGGLLLCGLTLSSLWWLL